MAAFTGPKGSGNRHRGGPSPGRSAGDFQSLVAHHPGARTVYRRGDLRSRGIGENQRLHEPVCPAASRLASGQSAEAGGGVGARSQGRLLPRHPANPDRSGPGEGLHRAWHGRPLAMEPALGLVARFLLAGLHRFQLAQSTIRQGQGTVLAASLYQSGPLDHRASPGLPGAMGDVAAGLPLRHRPGAFRGQDRGSREAVRRPEQRDGFRGAERLRSPTHKPCRMGLDQRSRKRRNYKPSTRAR